MPVNPEQPDTSAQNDPFQPPHPVAPEGLMSHPARPPAAPGTPLDLLDTQPATAENPPWNGWDVLLVMVVAFAALIVGGIAISVVIAALIGAKHLEPDQLNADLRFIIPIQLTMYAAAVGMMFQTIRVRYRRRFGEGISWNWPRQRAWRWIATGLILAAVVQIAELIVPMPKNLPIEKYFSTPLNAYLMGILGVLIAPVVEELFFRGFLYPVVARRFGVGGGVLLTGAVFAVFHAAQLGYAWTPLLIMLIVGVTLTAVRAFTKSVAASTLAHVSYNFVLMATLWIATDHFRHLERITQ
jgi:uncharacterized protein